MISDARAMWIVLWTVALAYLSMMPVMASVGMSLDIASLRPLALIVLAIIPFVAYGLWRRMAVVPESLVCAGVVIALAVPILVWTYAAMRLNRPLADAELAAMDAALRFDWRWFIDFVDSRPLLAWMLAEAYGTFYLQLLLLPVLLALFGYGRRVYAMVFAYCLICLISSVVSIWYPALGTYVVYGVGLDDLVHINAKFGYFFLEQFHAVRDSASFTLVLSEGAGIVTFPSVHAGIAALCAWAAWEARLLRYPLLVLNIAMAVSAISHANHYLVDVIAGVAIAAVSVGLTIALFREPRKRSSAVPSTTPAPISPG